MHNLGWKVIFKINRITATYKRDVSFLSSFLAYVTAVLCHLGPCPKTIFSLVFIKFNKCPWLLRET